MPAFTLRLEPAVSKKLTQYCKKNGQKKTTVINRVLKEVLEEKKSEFPVKITSVSALRKMAGSISLGGNSVEECEDYWS